MSITESAKVEEIHSDEEETQTVCLASFFVNSAETFLDTSENIIL